MTVKGIVHIRFVCTTHNMLLRNVGNGRFIAPTDSSNPTPQSFGWMEFDFSEYACPTKGEEDMCEFEVEGTDEDVS